MLNGLAMADFVKSLHDELVEGKIPEYLGTRIFYSKFIRNPNYLLMGLNPGPDIFNNYEKGHGKKMCNLGEFEDNKDFDYWQSGSPYIQSIKDVFTESGKGQELGEIVITNCNFQGTDNTHSFYKLIPKMSLICRKKYKDIPYTSIQSKMIMDLITEIDPKYIILVGSAFKFFTTQFLNGSRIKYYSLNNNLQNHDLEEISFNLNNSRVITAVLFPRAIYGIDNAYKDSVTQWLKDH